MRSAATANRLGTCALGLALGVAVAAAALACGTFSSADVSAPPADAGSDARCTGPRACSCVVGAVFCADFEGTTAVEEWELKTEENGGTLSFGASDRSAPHARQAATSPSAADGGPFGATSKAVVAKTFFADVAKVSLSFDMAAPSPPCAKDSDATYFVSLIPADGIGSAALLQTKSGPKLFVNGGVNEYTALKLFTNTKTWTHVTMEAKGGMFIVSYDGAPAAAPIPFATTSSAFVLAIGLTNEPAATACAVSYDNVVLRVVP